MPGIDLPILPETPPAQLQSEVIQQQTILSDTVGSAVTDNKAEISFVVFLAYGYLCVTTVLVANLIYGLYRIKLLSRTGGSKPAGNLISLLDELAGCLEIQRRVKLIVSSKVDTPITYGIFSPVIIWPEKAQAWTPAAVQCALAHELAHIKRLDWASLLVARMACIVFWMIPMTWMFARQLSYDAERASDDLVLSTGNKASFYADQLLSLSQGTKRRQQTNIAVVAMLQPAAIFDRIKAIVDVRQNRESINRSSIIAYAVPSVFILLAVAAINTTAMTQTSRALDGLWSEGWYRISLLKIEKDIEQPPAATEVDIKKIKLSAKAVGNKPSWKRNNIALDTMVVTGIPLEQGFMASEEDLAINDFKEPAIQIEGYLPLHTVTPAYPVVAQRKGIEGYVVVRFSIDSSGIPYDIEIVEANPIKVFDRAVLKAIGQSRYLPHSINSQRVSIKGVTSRIRFILDSPRKSKARAFSRHERSPPVLLNTS